MTTAPPPPTNIGQGSFVEALALWVSVLKAVAHYMGVDPKTLVRRIDDAPNKRPSQRTHLARNLVGHTLISMAGKEAGKAWIKVAMRASPQAISRMMQRPPKPAEVAAVLGILKAQYLNRSSHTEVSRAYADGWFS